jgi:hypothetical protein
VMIPLLILTFDLGDLLAGLETIVLLVLAG